MAVGVRPLFRFDNTFVHDLAGLYEPWRPSPAPAPELLVLNDELAAELGVDPDMLRTAQGVGVLAGNVVAEGAEPVAQAYAGHQFGGFSPRLGDGRALLLGEIVDVLGRRRDLHLKGSGRTPFARGGDGKAAVGPMLREYLIGEAMHALGIPTTRALAVVATGEVVVRETLLPGAVLTRVASSHLRVGTFQYAARHDDPSLIGRLADHAIARHHHEAADAANRYVALLEQVVDVQASLVARWMGVGFIHGVMNTDNMTISGETIDYGPCAFMDTFEPDTVFSSIDHGGRYAYGNQPAIAQWNLARLAETLLPLIDQDIEAAIATATDVLHSFTDRFHRYRDEVVGAKLGLAPTDDVSLGDDLLSMMQTHAVDMTSGFRALSAVVRGDPTAARTLFADPAPIDAWSARWLARLPADPDARHLVAAGMDLVNPVYVPRNHLVEEALDAATAGDLGPFRLLLGLVTRPFDEHAGLERYAEPAPSSFGGYQTFCGT